MDCVGQSLGAEIDEINPMAFQLDRQSLDAHKQLFESSCIPMSVELVLKQLKKIPGDFFKLQEQWQNKKDGSFADFDGQTVQGITFHRRFCQPRDLAFPIDDLFRAIETELDEGRLVIISLAVESGWHNYVIYDRTKDGDFLVVTKSGAPINSVKQAVTSMKGTDILVYDQQ